MTLTRRDIVSGLIFGAGAAALYLYAAQIPARAGQPAAVSAGFYPKLLAAILGILSLIQIVSAIVAEARGQSQRARTAAPRWWKDRSAFLLSGATFLLLILYPLFLNSLGFLIAAFVFLVILTFLLSAGQRSGRQLVLLVALTLGLTVLTYLVFREFLQIPFPYGVIFQP